MPTLYVSPTGTDTASGSQAAPLGTLAAALKKTRTGGTIYLEPGSHPAITDSVVRSQSCYVIGQPGASLAGVQVKGGRMLRFVRVPITGQTTVDYNDLKFTSPTDRLANFAKHISFTSCSFTGTVRVQNASQRITLDRCRIHDVTTGCGLLGPGRVDTRYRSRYITVTNTTIEDVVEDCIQFADWADVRIGVTDAGDPGPCTFRRAQDTTHTVHNDGIQCTGGSERVWIENNTISAVSQPIILQDSGVPRPNRGFTVRKNVLGQAYALGLQAQGVYALTVEGNDMRLPDDGGMRLTKGNLNQTAYPLPTDTVVRGNLLASFEKQYGYTPLVDTGNIIGR